MHVEKLRLVGFKSFVDATELTIAPGLTGIVGPNGCGKSNLVEALRWVMGETSAKRLRGGEMDEMIFGGSAGRPARNLAEVSLAIDNSARDAPFAFNEGEQIEILRRIERGGGSSYRINGREVRARDVQLLFADAATGPHSGALVSQGRVGALIAAKPVERRLLLDEAAGTAGLQARRHEAELKLKAAEENLGRVDDIVATLASQLDSLKKQVRQAQRYRRLAEQIRWAEALVLQARWRAAERDAERLGAELRAAERTVASATEQALAGRRGHQAAEADLPALRLAEAEAAAKLQRLTHAREALESELKRVLAARAESERRLGQAQADLLREDEHLADAEAALARLAAEREALARTGDSAAPARSAAEAALSQAAVELTAAEAGLQQMTEACVTEAARRSSFERQWRDAGERRSRTQSTLAETRRQHTALAATAVSPEAARAALDAVAAAEREVDRRRAGAEADAQALVAAQAAEADSVDALREAAQRQARLRAEGDALEGLLASATPVAASPGETPLLARLHVPHGLEAAIGALFGDELLAPVVEHQASTPAAWVVLPRLTDSAALPEGAGPLATEIDAPPALERRLALTGLVATEEQGRQLQARLAPGQSLVDPAGRLWRWDGFTRAAPAASSAAEQHLRQRNRHTVLIGELAAADATVASAEARAQAARATREESAARARRAADELRDGEAVLARARTAEAELSRRAVTVDTRLAGLSETLDKLAAEIADAEALERAAERGLALLPDPALARAALDGAREQATAARRREADARAAIDRLAREAELRRERLSAIATEEGWWRKRRGAAAAQRHALAERQSALAREIADLASRPAAIAAESEALGAASARAAEQRRAAADSLAEAETRLRAAAETLRRSEQAVAEAREALARLEVQSEAAAQALVRLRGEIRERVDAAPETLAELVGPPGEVQGLDAAELGSRLDRLLRERDGMGPVNLVAEAEAEEVEARIAGLQRERAELSEAVARLRRGIAALDHEARKRLVAAFEQLNEHFTGLFTRLFGGGRAHLALEEGADPLAAGLDIMASPPGKRLQSLSLLSGGEQALTAIALLFAAFLTRPAPVCVLDEVDAPLDDANVDRFCRLVAETADATGTRFLVVTHHRITMARMDRLFGVTMAERGVSQLVSVDLARAAELRRTA